MAQIMITDPTDKEGGESHNELSRQRRLVQAAPVSRLPVRGGWFLGSLGFLELLIPPVCLGCHRRMGGRDTLCGACWSRITFIRPPLCDVLGLPMPFDPGGRIVSAGALAKPPVYDRARAVASFGEVMRNLIHGFKYADRLEVRHLFARWLGVAGHDLLSGADMIVPVPLHRWRLLYRKFNQAAILGKDVSRLSGVPFEPTVLFRSRNTRSQVGLTTVQRRENMAGAFTVTWGGRQKLLGRSVLLIDDVITTGSTASACARVLKRAGAARVDVLALAMVTDELLFDL